MPGILREEGLRLAGWILLVAEDHADQMMLVAPLLPCLPSMTENVLTTTYMQCFEL